MRVEQTLLAWRRARRRAGGAAVDAMFRGLSRLGRLHPQARPERHGVEVLRDVSYRDTGSRAHLLDVYRPEGEGPFPTVLYVHGGGFRILSKETHWMMGLAFARRGYLVFNVNYRLAPKHPYPAAIEDVCAAWRWLAARGPEYGADLDRVVLAGESAGANLVTSLALATASRRPEPYAAAAFDVPVAPRAVVAACGMLQVSDPARIWRRRPLRSFVRDRIDEVSRGYLGGDGRGRAPQELELADPLVTLERGPDLARPLPPFYAFAGTRDPILDDTRRLGRALEALDVPVKVSVFPGELHAFHAFVWRPAAREAWRETYAFLDEALGPG